MILLYVYILTLTKNGLAGKASERDLKLLGGERRESVFCFLPLGLRHSKIVLLTDHTEWGPFFLVSDARSQQCMDSLLKNGETFLTCE